MAKNTAVATIQPASRPSLVAKFAARYNVEPEKMLGALKATAFKTGKNEPEVSNEQMIALLVVADQYGLNPFLKEIFAFPDKRGGIVPMVPVDGWIRIINDRPELSSIEFFDAETEDGEIPAWIECEITRKDRDKPIRVREYFAECKRNTDPWSTHPRRMLRHKALIQCARIAFGFAGIYDPDEGERVAQAIDVTPRTMKPQTQAPRALDQAKPEPAADGELSEEELAAMRAADAAIIETEAGARG